MGGNRWSGVALHRRAALSDGTAGTGVRFDARSPATGITVRYVERRWWRGSGTSERQERRTNPQATTCTTAPPFIQRAAAEKLLATLTPTPHRLSPMPTTFIRRGKNYQAHLQREKAAETAPASWQDLLDGKFKK